MLSAKCFDAVFRSKHYNGDVTAFARAFVDELRGYESGMQVIDAARSEIERREKVENVVWRFDSDFANTSLIHAGLP